MGKRLSKYLRYPQEDSKEELTSNKKRSQLLLHQGVLETKSFQGNEQFCRARYWQY